MLYFITFIFLVIPNGEAYAIRIRPCVDTPSVINACVILFLIGTIVPLTTKLLLIHKINRKIKNDLLILIALNALIYPVTLWLAYVTWTKINTYLAWVRSPSFILESPDEFSKRWQQALLYTLAFSSTLLAEAFLYRNFFKVGKYLSRPFLTIVSCITAGWLAGFAYFSGNRPHLGAIFYRPCNGGASWSEGCIEQLAIIGTPIAIILWLRYMIAKYKKDIKKS